MSQPVTICVVDGVEGPSVYINDTRVAGPKPWGGGTVLHEWKEAHIRHDILRALGLIPWMAKVGTEPEPVAQNPVAVKQEALDG